MTLLATSAADGAFVIAASCAACGECANVCPEPAAIVSGDVYRIDPDACIRCGACVEVCMTSSIYAARPLAGNT